MQNDLKFLRYGKNKGFLTQKAFATKKTRLKQCKLKIKKEQALLRDLLTLPRLQAFDLLETEREFFKQDN